MRDMFAYIKTQVTIEIRSLVHGEAVAVVGGSGRKILTKISIA